MKGPGRAAPPPAAGPVEVYRLERIGAQGAARRGRGRAPGLEEDHPRAGRLEAVRRAAGGRGGPLLLRWGKRYCKRGAALVRMQ